LKVGVSVATIGAVIGEWVGAQQGLGYLMIQANARLNVDLVFTTKASISSGLIQNLEPNWQLFGEMSIINEDFGSLMPSLSLTLNPEP
jgi:hypothetical protein